MDLVDEEDVPLLKIRQDGGQVSGMGQDQAGGRADRHPHFSGDDVGDGGFPEAGRAVKNGMVQRLAALLRRVDTDSKRLLHPVLAHIVVQTLRAEGDIESAVLFSGLSGQQALAHGFSPVPGAGVFRMGGGRSAEQFGGHCTPPPSSFCNWHWLSLPPGGVPQRVELGAEPMDW